MVIFVRIDATKDGEVVENGAADVNAIQRKIAGRDIAKEYYREEKQKPYRAEKMTPPPNDVSAGARD